MESQPFGKGRVVLLELVSFGKIVDLAVVDPRVEHPECLGDGFDPLVVHPGGGEHLLGLLVISGHVGLRELVGLRHQCGDLVLHEIHIVLDRLVKQSLVVTGEFDGVARHLEGRLAHVGATHARFAGSEVVTRLQADRQVRRGTGRNVLTL